MLAALGQRLDLQLQLSQDERGAPVELHLGQRRIRVWWGRGWVGWTREGGKALEQRRVVRALAGRPGGLHRRGRARRRAPARRATCGARRSARSPACAGSQADLRVEGRPGGTHRCGRPHTGLSRPSRPVPSPRVGLQRPRPAREDEGRESVHVGACNVAPHPCLARASAQRARPPAGSPLKPHPAVRPTPPEPPQ